MQVILRNLQRFTLRVFMWSYYVCSSVYTKTCFNLVLLSSAVKHSGLHYDPCCYTDIRHIRPHQISPIQFRQFGSRNHNGKFNARQIIIWFLCTYIQYNSSVKGTTQSENVSNACFCTPLCGFWFWLYLNT